MSTLTSEHSTIRNADEFRARLSILNQAAVGVVQVRTSEPYRAIESLRDFAFVADMDFRMWTILKGWQVFKKGDPNAEPTLIPQTDQPFPALKRIEDMDQPVLKEKKAFPDRGVYAMFHPHFFINSHAGIIQ